MKRKTILKTSFVGATAMALSPFLSGYKSKSLFNIRPKGSSVKLAIDKLNGYILTGVVILDKFQ